MELLELLRIIDKYRGVIIVMMLSSVVGTVGLTYVIQERFESTALVLVRPQEQIKFTGGVSDKETLNFPIPRVVPFEAMSKTFGEVIRSRTVAEDVVRRLGLDVATNETVWWKIWKRRIKDALDDAWTYLKYGRVESSDPFLEATQLVQKLISVEPTKDTYVFEIRFQGKTPDLAAAVVNTAAEVFVEYNLDLYRSESSLAREFIEAQVRESEQEVAAARSAILGFKERYGIVALDQEVENQVDEVAELRTEYERLRREVAANEAEVGALAAQLGVTRSHAPAGRERLIAGSLRDDLMARLVVAESNLASARASQLRIESTIAQRESALESLPQRQLELARLTLDLTVVEDTFRFVRKAYDEARIREAEQVQEIRVIAPGTASTYPVRPVKVYYAGAALVLSLIVSLVLALLLEYLNFALESTEDAQEALQLPLLATIPRVRG